MNFNITVNRKFKINGTEYNSMEEMPDDIREKFKKMMDSLADSGNQTNLTALQKKIAFNIDLAKLGNAVQKEPGSIETAHIPRPTKVEPTFSSRILIVSVILGALLYLLYYLWHGRL